MNQPAVELIFVGGYVYPKTGVALGDLAVSALQNINVSRLVMSAGGVTGDGLFNSNALLVETERKMIDAAEYVTLVADSTKFGQRALAQICDLDAVDEIITDDRLSHAWRETLTNLGITLEIVEVSTTPVTSSEKAIQTRA